MNVKPVGNGQAVLKYLAPYVFRVAISDNRIVDCDQTSVSYRYTPSKSKTSKTRTVSGERLVKGSVQHLSADRQACLPTGRPAAQGVP